MNPSSDRKRENGNPPPKVNAPALDPTAPVHIHIRARRSGKQLDPKELVVLKIARIEAGKYIPSLETAMKIAKTFEVPIDYLMNSTEGTLAEVFNCLPKRLARICRMPGYAVCCSRICR